MADAVATKNMLVVLFKDRLWEWYICNILEANKFYLLKHMLHMPSFWSTWRKTISERNLHTTILTNIKGGIFLDVDFFFVYVWSLLRECLEKVSLEMAKKKWRQRRVSEVRIVKCALCFIEFDILRNYLEQVMWSKLMKSLSFVGKMVTVHPLLGS